MLPAEENSIERTRYKISYNADGGELPSGAVGYIEQSKENFKLPEPEKKDYIFLGWYDNAKFTGEAVSEITSAGQDIALYARYAAAEVTYAKAEFSAAMEKTEYYSESAASASGGGGIAKYVLKGTLPPGLAMSEDGVVSGTPTAAGEYTFEVEAEALDGSSVSSSYTLSVLASPDAREVDGPLVINSGSSFVYGEDYYILTNGDNAEGELTYRIVGGSGSGYIGDRNRLYVEAAGTFVLVTEAEREIGGKTVVQVSEPFTVDVKKATLTVSSRSMAYIVGDVIYASDINVVATGFVFGDNMMNDVDRSGFRMTINGEELPSGGFTLPAGEYEVSYTGLTSKKYNIAITPFALRVYSAYTVTFDANGGNGAPGALRIQENQPLPESASVPVRGGYGFTGWYTEKECVNRWNFMYDTVKSDLTLYAGWDSEICIVSFKYNGAGPDRIMTAVPVGTVLDKPEPPVLEGKYFAGWFADAEYTDKWDFSADTVTADLSLYAKFVTVTYTVSYSSSPGTRVEANEGVGYDSLIRPLPQSPTLEGMHFAGWYYDEKCERQFIPAFDTVQNDLKLFAKWIAKTYTVFGGVADCEGTIMPGVPVTLRQGQSELASSVTDENGLFRFVYVPAGIYTLEAYDAESDVSVTYAVTVINEDVLDIVIMLSPDSTGSAVSTGEGLAGVTVAGLNGIFSHPLDTNLTASDQATLRGGGKVVAEMIISADSASLRESVALMEEFSAERGIIMSDSFEFTIIKTVINKEGLRSLSYITETEAEIVVTIPMTEEMRNRNNYSVIRDHYGELELLTPTPNGRGEYIEVLEDRIDIHTKRFSTFSVCYDEQVVPSWSWLVAAIPIALSAVFIIAVLYDKARSKRI